MVMIELGTYMPKRWARDVGKARRAAAAVAKAQGELRANGIDLDAEMAAMGLTPLGEPLKEDLNDNLSDEWPVQYRTFDRYPHEDTNG